MSNPAASAPVSVDPSGLDAAEFPASGPLDRFNAELKARVRAVCAAAEALDAFLNKPLPAPRDLIDEVGFVGDGRGRQGGFPSDELRP